MNVQKVIMFTFLLVLGFALVGCGGTESVSTEPASAEELRIEENNASILPKLEALEASLVAIEKVAAENAQIEKYQGYADGLREEFVIISGNHDKIIAGGGYSLGTDEFAQAVDGAILRNEEMLALINEDVAARAVFEELSDRTNDLIDVTNKLSILAQENGWDKNAEFLAEMGVIYGFVDEVLEKIETSDVIEQEYKNEKVAVIDELIDVVNEYLEMVSVPYSE